MRYRAFSAPPVESDHQRGTAGLRQLGRHRADGTGCGRYPDPVARLHPRDVDQADVGGQSRDAQDMQPRVGRQTATRLDADPLTGVHYGVVTPPSPAQRPVAFRPPIRARLHDSADSPRLHRGSEVEGRRVGVHREPGDHRRVHAETVGPDKQLALRERWQFPLDERKAPRLDPSLRPARQHQLMGGHHRHSPGSTARRPARSRACVPRGGTTAQVAFMASQVKPPSWAALDLTRRAHCPRAAVVVSGPRVAIGRRAARGSARGYRSAARRNARGRRY